MMYRVYYMKPEWFREFSLGTTLPARDRLAETHTFVRDVEARDLDEVYHRSQAEIWSPNGEASDLIRVKGLRRTSMGVGDVIEDPQGTFWAVASVGFAPLG